MLDRVDEMLGIPPQEVEDSGGDEAPQAFPVAHPEPEDLVTEDLVQAQLGDPRLRLRAQCVDALEMVLAVRFGEPVLVRFGDIGPPMPWLSPRSTRPR
jgi:hypothetical protein